MSTGCNKDGTYDEISINDNVTNNYDHSRSPSDGAHQCNDSLPEIYSGPYPYLSYQSATKNLEVGGGELYTKLVTECVNTTNEAHGAVGEQAPQNIVTDS